MDTFGNDSDIWAVLNNVSTVKPLQASFCLLICQAAPSWADRQWLTTLHQKCTCTSLFGQQFKSAHLWATIWLSVLLTVKWHLLPSCARNANVSVKKDLKSFQCTTFLAKNYAPPWFWETGHIFSMATLLVNRQRLSKIAFFFALGKFHQVLVPRN